MARLMPARAERPPRATRAQVQRCLQRSAELKQSALARASAGWVFARRVWQERANSQRLQVDAGLVRALEF